MRIDEVVGRVSIMASSYITCRAFLFASWLFVIAEDGVILTRYCVLELLLTRLWR